MVGGGQTGDGLVRQALDLEFRLVVADAVLALVELRHDDDGELDVTPLDGAARLQLHEKVRQMIECGRHVRQHRRLVAERAVALHELLVGLGILGLEARGGKKRNAAHETDPVVGRAAVVI